jgi:hypothetical protein
MPRMKASGTTVSGLRQFQRQARSELNKVRRAIRGTEAELARLKAYEESLSRVAGGAAAPRGPRAARAAAAGGGGRRINWRAVLGQLPKQFKASNIRQVRGLKDKRPSEIFAAVTRWIEAGLVKRKARGIYERA